MNSIEIDFYTGYEGSDEIIISCETKHFIKKIRIWDGYFNSIMRQLKLSDDGTWTGLAYCYNLFTCWYDEDSWQIPDLKEALSQLSSIDLLDSKNLCDVTEQVLIEITIMLSEAIDENATVYILLQ
jgi:hypothetical protein